MHFFLYNSCILLTDNEPGLFIMQAQAAMSHGANSARRSKRPATTTYITIVLYVVVAGRFERHLIMTKKLI